MLLFLFKFILLEDRIRALSPVGELYSKTRRKKRKNNNNNNNKMLTCQHENLDHSS